MKFPLNNKKLRALSEILRVSCVKIFNAERTKTKSYFLLNC
jgi:hypothetical protein